LTRCVAFEEDRDYGETDAEPSRTCLSQDFVMAKGILPSRSLLFQARFECRVAGERWHIEEACRD